MASRPARRSCARGGMSALSKPRAACGRAAVRKSCRGSVGGWRPHNGPSALYRRGIRRDTHADNNCCWSSHSKCRSIQSPGGSPSRQSQILGATAPALDPATDLPGDIHAEQRHPRPIEWQANCFTFLVHSLVVIATARDAGKSWDYRRARAGSEVGISPGGSA